jgi:hypothetical protein
VGGVGQRDPKVFGLTAGDLTVELREPEQGRAATLRCDLCRLALGVKPSVAHETAAATDLERDDHPVAHGQVLDVGPDLDHPTHGFVTQDVSGVHEGPEHLIQV